MKKLGSATRKDYQDAMDVQDAVNGIAVAGMLSEFMSRMIRNGDMSTDDVNEHPVTILLISKLISLSQSGMTYFDIFSEAWNICEQKAQGLMKDVTDEGRDR